MMRKEMMELLTLRYTRKINIESKPIENNYHHLPGSITARIFKLQSSLKYTYSVQTLSFIMGSYTSQARAVIEITEKLVKPGINNCS